ncbi:hypothetical protein MKZ38_004609 [Zalerion maritima]|uniref:Uncharacterized protein n=1 Tax=Zalerion maritima TaxID=339359 RepID=A0AAD5WWE9_9PEZI|nr:hypothetical protein MKZ38_004609 [Zalerion maritima]
MLGDSSGCAASPGRTEIKFSSFSRSPLLPVVQRSLVVRKVCVDGWILMDRYPCSKAASSFQGPGVTVTLVRARKPADGIRFQVLHRLDDPQYQNVKSFNLAVPLRPSSSCGIRYDPQRSRILRWAQSSGNRDGTDMAAATAPKRAYMASQFEVLLWGKQGRPVANTVKQSSATAVQIFSFFGKARVYRIAISAANPPTTGWGYETHTKAPFWTVA